MSLAGPGSGAALAGLTNLGQLIVVKPRATTYEPVAGYRVSDTQTWGTGSSAGMNESSRIGFCQFVD
jgi:hypothetical protein